MFDLPLDELGTMLVRLGGALFIGGLLGIDRDLHHKPAGVRVLSLVTLGAALVVMVSEAAIGGIKGTQIGEGALRTVQGILSGIGFLGAGVIIHSGTARGSESIHGLTTAATIWVAAGLGIACGLGQWLIALVAAILALLVTIAGRKFEAVLQRWQTPREP